MSEETRVEKKGIFLLRVLHARIWTLVSTTLLEKDQFILKKLKKLQGVRGREGKWSMRLLLRQGLSIKDCLIFQSH